MDLTVDEFNKQVPEGTQVLYFEYTDSLPITTTTIVGEAFELDGSVFVKTGMGGEYLSISKLETCNQEQFDKIRAVLDGRL